MAILSQSQVCCKGHTMYLCCMLPAGVSSTCFLEPEGETNGLAWVAMYTDRPPVMKDCSVFMVHSRNIWKFSFVCME